MRVTQTGLSNQDGRTLVQWWLRQCNMRSVLSLAFGQSYTYRAGRLHAVVTRSCNSFDKCVFRTYNSCTWSMAKISCRHSLSIATSVIIQTLAVVELRKNLKGDATLSPRS